MTEVIDAYTTIRHKLDERGDLTGLRLAIAVRLLLLQVAGAT